MNANTSYLAWGQNEKEYTRYLAILLQRSLRKPPTITNILTNTRADSQAEASLATVVRIKNLLVPLPVPSSVSSGLKWLSTNVTADSLPGVVTLLTVQSTFLAAVLA